MDVPKEEVVFALDAILDPVSLFEPVFHDGTDTVCVMDQVGDTKNTDDNWLAGIALRDAMSAVSSGFASSRDAPRWRWHAKYTFRQTKGRKIPVLFLLYIMYERQKTRG